MKSYRIFLLVIISTSIIGCAGKLQYFPPQTNPTLNNEVTINKSKEDVWKYLIPMLGKQFYVINNLDKNSGIINVSYGGDPEKYVDCGRIYSYVKNAQGERTYDFPASKENQTYEVMDLERGHGLIFYNRKMNLEGRLNIVVEEISSNQTKLTINTKYILTRNISARKVNSKFPSTLTDTISFNSGRKNSFTNPGNQQQTECQPTGHLEEDILSLLTGLQK